MLIRRAELADAGKIAAMHIATWRAAYRGIVPNAYLESLSVEQREATCRESLSKGVPAILVACDNADIIGWVVFGRARDAGQSGLVGEVEALYVAPAHWSHGVGRELWLTARRLLRKQGFTKIIVWSLMENSRADRFYR